jgi:hypothetical protein
MHRIAALLPLVLALVVPVSARAAGEIYTVAGTGTQIDSVRAGEPATEADLFTDPSVAALPDGGFLVSTSYQVWRVGPDGRTHLVAGTDRIRPSGDGGPALRAALIPDSLAVLPGGGFLIGDEFRNRVRMVDARGVITTVAGGGKSHADGIPATQAKLDDVNSIAAMPGGGFVIAQDGKVRRVGPDGRIRTIAGGGRTSDEELPPLGAPATTLELEPEFVAAEDDGSVLITSALEGRILRVSPGGRLTVAAVLPAGADPEGLAGAPGGGFFLSTAYPALARIWRGAPDGTLTLIAGGGPFTFTAPGGLEQRLTGESAMSARLGDVGDVSVLPDGGVLVGDEASDAVDGGGLIHYIAPAAPSVLAAAILRSRDRLISAHAVSLSLTVPAAVTLRVAGRTVTAQLPAGVSRVPLPALPAAEPHRVRLIATTPGHAAYDDSRLYPSRWLPTETAALVAQDLAHRVLRHPDPLGSRVAECHRFSATRVDCVLDGDRHTCGIAAVSYVHDRLRWSAYGCDFRRRLTRRWRPLTRREAHCGTGGPPCPAGRVTEEELLPSR